LDSYSAPQPHPFFIINRTHLLSVTTHPYDSSSQPNIETEKSRVKGTAGESGLHRVAASRVRASAKVWPR